MKKTLLPCFLIFFVSFFLLANSSLSASQKRGLRVTPRDTNELYNFIESKEKKFANERQDMDEIKKKVRARLDKLKVSAQTLMMMENMLGASGGEVYDIADELNTISQESVQLEEKILKRSSWKKFFFGYKKQNKDKFSELLTDRKEKIDELQNLYDACDCPRDLKDIFSEKLEIIKEQNSQSEALFSEVAAKNGILGWIFKIF